MPAAVDICNLALSHVGVSTEIQSLETERTKEAQACNRFYAPSVDEVLRAFAWPFATAFADLQVVEVDPTDEWGFSYRQPSECVTTRRILSGNRNDSRATRIPFRNGRDTTGPLIYTDMEDAVLEYTVRVTDPTQFAPDFASALSYKLASKIGPRFGPEAVKLANRALQLYGAEIADAQAAAANESQPDLPPDSEFISIRGGG